VKIRSQLGQREQYPAIGIAWWGRILGVSSDGAPSPDRPSERVVAQRIRNRVIEYLDLAGSFEAQRDYEMNVPIAHVPYEVINQWGDQFPQGPAREFARSTAFSSDEQAAALAFDQVLEEVSRAIPDDYPTLEAVQTMPAWHRLQQAALDAGAVFARRGRLSEVMEEI